VAIAPRHLAERAGHRRGDGAADLSATASLETLAVFGGSSTFREPLHVGRPNIGDRTRLQERIDQVLDSRWLTNDGPFVDEFEARIAAALAVDHCIVTCNATVALEILIRALRLTGEVILPSFTFIATAHAVSWLGLTPVFCDIDPATHTLDPSRVEELITPRTSAIIAVHLWGRGCAVAELGEIADRHDLRLVFDSAHAFGCSHQGRRIGGFGDAEVFSFHATKFLNSLEGGAVTTNDADLARDVRMMRNFGFAGYDTVGSMGTNGKMNEMAAAVGITNLESAHDFIAVNRRNLDAYRAVLREVPGVRLIEPEPNERHNYQYVVVEVDEAEAGLSRDDLYQVLWAEHILARRYFYPGCHRQEPYRSRSPEAGLRLAATEGVAERVLVLPTGTAVTPDDIAEIGATIALAVASGEVVHTRLGAVGAAGTGSHATR
jgi:dTDP-4-amino-4,6-dideoxygalactose transaminase